MPSPPKKTGLQRNGQKDSHHAGQALADVMEAYGHHAYDTAEASADQTRKRFQALAHHVRTAGQVLRLIEPVANRPDWDRVVSLFTGFRSGECNYIKKSLRDLRRLIWSFVHLFDSNLEVDSRTESKISVQAEKMKAAVEGNSIEELKKQAESTLHLLEDVLHEIEKKREWQLNQLSGHIQVLRVELTETRRELETDGLTRLYNRKALDEHLLRLKPISTYGGHPTTLMLMDIDHFKSVNDDHGHQWGDEVLREFSNILLRVFPRNSDFVARYGGEEFAVVLEEDGKKVASELGEKLRGAVSRKVFSEKEERFSVTVSVGIAELRRGESLQDWIKRADEALYEAKDTGRNKVVVG